MKQDLESLEALGYSHFQLAPQAHIGGWQFASPTLGGATLEYAFAEGASGPFGKDLTGYWMGSDLIAPYLPLEEWADIHAALSADEQAEILSIEDLSVPGSSNIALDRPATQSSVSSWSTGGEPHADARVANNGDTSSPIYFHTDIEANPWWQVDLEGLYHVAKIVLYNRYDHIGRLTIFTILGSPDGLEWTTLYKKTDRSSVTVFVANIGESDPVRFLRVVLDGYGCLHLRECQVFGRRSLALAHRA